MMPPRFCRCRAPRPEADAQGVTFCAECGEIIREREVARDRLLLALAREVAALRHRVAELEGAQSNGGGSNGNGAGVPDQLTLEEISR